MLSTPTQYMTEAHLRQRFHRRSLEQQRPLSTVTMAFTVVAVLVFVLARSLVAGYAVALPYRLAGVLCLALLVAAVRRASTTWLFGAVGVAYTLVMTVTIALNVVGLAEPLLWVLPALLVIPICAAPLWLTPQHFVTGTALFYLLSIPLFLGQPLSHDVNVVAWLWVVTGIPTAAVFHLGFYWFRRDHFLLEDRLARLAATDPLTGLQNRRAFMEQADKRLAALAEDARVCAIYVDIDYFKSLNDQFGHALGDQTLYEVAQVLVDEVGLHDSVSRIGGEEFAVLRRDGLESALELAERMRAAIACIARPDGFVTASFGVAEHRRGENVMALLDRADEALLRAKYSGRNRVCAERQIQFDPLQLLQGDDAADLAADGTGKRGPRWDDYYLTSHFQPLYSLSHQKQVGFEALLRGEQDDGTLVPPVVLFAPRPLNDEGALDRASHAVHLRNARRQIRCDAWIFLNIQPSTFVAEGYADQLATLARSAGLAPEKIVLEILESHGGSVDDMSRAAARYREFGFLIAVDDFGAGQSNLDRLFRIRPDFVKLDGELIRATIPGTQQSILPKLVSLLHQAGMLVVVEGVETIEELTLAVESNVDFAQGYLLGRPSPQIAPPESVHRLIDQSFDVIAEGRARQHTLFESEVQPYRMALRDAADALMSGLPLDDAFADLARQDLCISCFVLDDRGRQIGHEVTGVAGAFNAESLQPVADPRDARWDHRPYFRNAVLLPGVPVTSSPYLSLASGRPCVAVTVAVQSEHMRSVVGTELDWSAPHMPWPAGE
jgi:diguanylate cyclase (GGDEF)-like protein